MNRQWMACWIGNALIPVHRTYPFLFCCGLQHCYFGRFANHVGRCRLLLQNHGLLYSQSARYLHDTWPIGSLPSPNPLPLPYTVKKCVKTVQQTKKCKITSWPIIGAVYMAAHCLFKLLTFFLIVEHQYIGARWLAAPLHWCIVKAIEMVSSTLTIHSIRYLYTVASGKGKRFVRRWRQNYVRDKRTSINTVRELYRTFVTFPTPLVFHWYL